MIDYIVFGVIAYLLGSIPTAVWVGKAWHNIDVREHGSKNAGATNTFRVLGRKPGIVVLAVDILKGLTAMLLPLLGTQGGYGMDSFVHVQLVCAVLVVLGHIFPIFAGFSGGKGVATSLGVIFGLHPEAAGICLGIFLIVFITTQYVSLGAICASISFPLLIILYFRATSVWLMVFSIALSVAVVAAHHKNIGRLLKGEESKMNLFKRKA